MRTVYSETLKIIYASSTKIILGLVFGLQALMAYMSSKQFLAVGLDATPLTNPELLEAVPPIQYIGFDSILLGMFVLIIMGGLIGAIEFKRKSIRTTFLSADSRVNVILAKIGTVTVIGALISFLAAYLSINLAHLALGEQGLHLFVLDGEVWRFLFFATVSQTLLIMLAFGLALLFHTAVVPFLFLLPQVYMVIYLPADSILMKLLPVPVGESLVATSPDAFSSTPMQALLVLTGWAVIVLTLACVRLIREDVGKYEE